MSYSPSKQCDSEESWNMNWKKTPQLWFSWQAVLLIQSLSSAPKSSFWYTVGLYLFKAFNLKYKVAFPTRNSFFLLLSDTTWWTWDLHSPDYLQLYSCHISVVCNGTCSFGQGYKITDALSEDPAGKRMILCWGSWDKACGNSHSCHRMPVWSLYGFVKFTSTVSFFSAFVGINGSFSAYIVSLLEKQLLTPLWVPCTHKSLVWLLYATKYT